MNYLLGMVPGIFAFAQFDALRAFLIGIGKTHLILIVQVVSTIAHFGFSSYLIGRLGLNLFGAGLAVSFTQMLNLTITRLSISCSQDVSVSFKLPGWENFYSLREYIKLALPTLVVVLYLVWYG